jgi:AcrR family transcriptional regulator
MSDVAPVQSPVAGKREQGKARNRRAILDAARAVFAEMGYQAATVRDIIRRTDLSVGAFYNYFRSKEEIYEALADDGARRFRPLLEAQSQAAGDFEGYIRGAIEAYFDFLLDEHLSGKSPEGKADARPHVRAETPEMLAVFAQVRGAIAEVLAKGHGPMVDIDYLAAACIAVAREVGERMLQRRPIRRHEAVEFAVRMILGGLPALPRIIV